MSILKEKPYHYDVELSSHEKSYMVKNMKEAEAVVMKEVGVDKNITAIFEKIKMFEDDYSIEVANKSKKLNWIYEKSKDIDTENLAKESRKAKKKLIQDMFS
jgi:hypothetical protein